MKRQYHKEYLTREELTAFLKAKLSSEPLEKVRDVFVFSCFTGLVYEDLKKLRAEQLMTLPSGSHYLRIYVPMTRFPRTIPLLDIPYKIIEKYKGYTRDNRIFPVPSNTSCNNILKKIAKQCGIKTRLTYHLARHTFGTLLTISQGVPIETVSRMMGHTNIKTTQIYAKITKEKISQDMEILSHKLESLEKQVMERI